MVRFVVGDFTDCQNLFPTLQIDNQLNQLHPKKFKERIEQLDGIYWTNNPYVLDNVSCDDVSVVFNNKTQLLSSHPDWPLWKDEMLAGEFWALAGNEWVK